MNCLCFVFTFLYMNKFDFCDENIVFLGYNKSTVGVYVPSLYRCRGVLDNSTGNRRVCRGGTVDNFGALQTLFRVAINNQIMF